MNEIWFKAQRNRDFCLEIRGLQGKLIWNRKFISLKIFSMNFGTFNGREKE